MLYLNGYPEGLGDTLMWAERVVACALAVLLSYVVGSRNGRSQR